MRGSAARPSTARISLALTNHIKTQWQKRGWLAYALWPLSFLTRAYVWINAYLFKHSHRTTQYLNKPVIVVGNVVVGGAGKTPVVIELIKYLHASGRKVGVVSKGYGRSKKQDARDLATSPARALSGEHKGLMASQSPFIEVLEHSPSSLVGDEPKLIHHKTGAPVFVGELRAPTAQALLDKHPELDIIISDDGLQHNALGRDINIVVFDNSGLGNGMLLPAGPLREPWPRIYQNAKTELILSTNEASAPQGFNVTRALSDFAINQRGEKLNLTAHLHSPIHAVAGIARPEVFFQMLMDKGLHLSGTTLLEDHAAFSHEEFDFGSDSLNPTSAKHSEETLFLCTEKDAIKIWEFNPNVWTVPLVCDLDPVFIDALEDALVQIASESA